MENTGIEGKMALLNERCRIQAKTLKRYREEKELLQRGACGQFARFQKIVLRLAANNEFIVPMKRTENSERFEPVEADTFFRYIEDEAGEGSTREFTHFCKSFGLIRIGTQNNIIFNSSNKGEKIRAVYLSKSVVNYIKGQGAGEAEEDVNAEFSAGAI